MEYTARFDAAHNAIKDTNAELKEFQDFMDELEKEYEDVDDETKIKMDFIMESADTLIDFKWKMGQFRKNGNTSFLGTDKSRELNNKLK
jgi:hypothetical protein